MIEHLKKSSFENHLDDTYRVALESNQFVDLVLEGVEEHQAHCKEYECFSIVFTGSKEMPLEQRTYEVTHERLGTFLLFLVPVGAGGEKLHYEAVFNRQKVK